MALSTSQLIYRTEQVREGEQDAAASQDISEKQLMQRAAQACLEHIRQVQQLPARLLILCGPGNNGGDGWVLARLAQDAGYEVQVAAAEPSSDLTQQACEVWREQGGKVTSLDQVSESILSNAEVIVDALLGTGLSRELSDIYLQLTELLNDFSANHRSYVLSVDCPTGLNSDTGQPMPVAVKAHGTVTMVALKTGLVTGQARTYCGELKLADLGIGEAFRRRQRACAYSINDRRVSEHLRCREASSHKGDHGHVLIVGGYPGLSGAAIMAGQAALRCGTGKVTVLTHPQSHAIVASAQPELMVHTLDGVTADDSNLDNLLSAADVVVLGPGLGQHEWGQSLFNQLIVWEGCLVMDADALNLLALSKHKPPAAASWLLTPHPGEAGRLLGCRATEIEQDRYAAVRKLADEFNAQVLLKGAGSLIAAPGDSMIQVCRQGSPALATGGSGDVLSGIIGALLAQRVPLDEVLAIAAWLHGSAGELAAKQGERGTLPTDLTYFLRRLVNPHQQLTSLTDNA
ncbi:NAD(P)H-hydrate dehydratase [Pseudidiomarina sp.]|uniref:NAD(P)H-hydrate dehydratase n=1 Tax=Pseudidiomarina sp. TaxID=2081707 RepID=UPI00299CE457|nr:NAD(P)H-hydrate dehydratase [Pseudidiomarina sp.]MDX1706718.1 NAD(P)H-hydrate dehydratase [Pseudidiomarina sp.]